MFCVGSISYGLFIRLSFRLLKVCRRPSNSNHEVGQCFALRLAGALQIGILTEGIFQNGTLRHEPPLADSAHVIRVRVMKSMISSRPSSFANRTPGVV